MLRYGSGSGAFIFGTHYFKITTYCTTHSNRATSTSNTTKSTSGLLAFTQKAPRNYVRFVGAFVLCCRTPRENY